MNTTRRVFCVGFNKTGTTSMKRCFRALGIQPIAPTAAHAVSVHRALIERKDYGPALQLAEKYRAFEDRPWNVWKMYRKLDERFPGSRFILTKREPERWWRSVERWLSYTKPRMATAYRKHLQAENLLEDSMIRAYNRYNNEIIEYFAGRDDLLVIDVEKDAGWERLCAFLGCPVPLIPFPHTNRQYYDQRDTKKDQVKQKHKTESPNAQEQELPCFYCGKAATEHLLPPRRSRVRRSLIKHLRKTHINIVEKDLRTLEPSSQRLERLQRQWPNLRLDDMAAVCCFFNPNNDQGVFDRYGKFRQSMQRSKIPLLTVELAFGDRPFQLGKQDENLLHVRSAAVMWHRERLLNLGIEELLRRQYRKIVWLDSNIVFEDDETWPWAVAAELEQSAVCQVFSHVLIHRGRNGPVAAGISAVKYFEETQRYLNQDFLERPSKQWPTGRPYGYAGYGWAANADVLRQVPLYDRAILGGGDRMLFAACQGYSDTWFQKITGEMTNYRFPHCKTCRHRIPAPQYAWHYSIWAQRWTASVKNRLSYVTQKIRDLSGAENLGDARELRRILLSHRYDPQKDIKSNEFGCWEWASDRPSLHRDVERHIQRASGA